MVSSLALAQGAQARYGNSGPASLRVRSKSRFPGRAFSDMCGRARLSSDVGEIKIVFGIPPARPTPNFPPSWNAAPTDSLPIVRLDAKAGQRSLDMLRWGLIPYWAKDINVGFANINAKAEGIENRPAFRKAFERRRCLVPVDNFYEWKKTAAGKTTLRDCARRSRHYGARGLMGELEVAAGEWIRTFAIITTPPTSCAPSSTTACPQYSNRRRGRPGSVRSRRPCLISKRCWSPTLPTP